MILIYISPIWTGVKDFFLKGSTSIYGMPAFYNILIRLLDDIEINKIYFITFNKNEIVIPEKN